MSLITVYQFVEKYPWPKYGGLRWLIFHEKTNGFDKAFKRVGRRVLVDEEIFWEIVRNNPEVKDAPN